MYTLFSYALSPLEAGILASLLGGFVATTAGALPVFVIRDLTPRVSNTLLAFAAGVMLSATFFSLILPSLDYGVKILGGRTPAALGTIAALLLGGAALWALHAFMPHEHFIKGTEGPLREKLARMWLFVLAIAVHNFPEGLTMGVGAGSGDADIGVKVTLAMGLQNLPEGLVVAMAMVGQGFRRGQAFLAAGVTGLVEVAGGVFGALAVSVSTALLPGALGFAAGAMLFVISNEVIPETHRSGYAGSATAALFVGFSTMLFLDVVLA